MQDAEKMKKGAGAKHQTNCHNSGALYDSMSMLKVFERLLPEMLEHKPVKKLDAEVDKRLEMMKKLLVHNSGIDNLEFQDIDCKDLKILKENEVFNQQTFVNEAIMALHLPTERESDRQSDDKNDISTSKKLNAAKLLMLDEVKKRKSTNKEILESADEEMYDEKLQQERSDLIDKKMESSSSSKTSPEGSTKIVLKITQASQPQNDQDQRSSQCSQVDARKLKPEWLEKFFNRTFFEPCPEHPIRRNELNKYCIDCDASLCQYCVSLASHANHRLMKIYRHVYKDVVPVDEIERHINCSQIQPYRCNRQMVIALTPLPHSGTKSNEQTSCLTCKRKLIEYEIYSYCSIACKAEAFIKKQNDFAPPFLMLDQVEQAENENVNENPNANGNGNGNEDEPISKNARKRKGIPRRAPLC